MSGVDDSGVTPQREIYSVGLKRKVLADVQQIIATPTKGGGFRYQVVGLFTDESGSEHKCQSMIGKADAVALASALGQPLDTPTKTEEVAEVEETIVMSAEEISPATEESEESEEFEAEEAAGGEQTGETPAEEPTLLVPEPSTYPTGDGRAIGAHTGLNIAADVGGNMSLPPTDYVWIGRSEDEDDEDEDLDISEGEETFVVHTSLKNFLAEEYWEDIMEGLMQIRLGNADDEWVLSFAPFLMEDIIGSIADFQQLDVLTQSSYQRDEGDDSWGVAYDFDWGNDPQFADWVAAEEFEAKGFADLADNMGDDNSSDWKTTGAIVTALLAISATYFWANRK